MPDRPLDEYQVLVTPDPRTRDAAVSLWRDAAHASFSEDGPHAGDPEPSGDYDAVLEAQGVCAADEDLWLRARNGGPIGRTQRSGTLTWRRDGDAATEERGWEPPSVPHGWENLHNYTAPTTALFPCVVTLQTAVYRDRVVVVHERDTGDIECAWRDPDTGTLTTGIVVHDAQATSTTMRAYHPCLVEAGERLYCLHWVPGHASASSNYYIRVQVSTDGGATWTTARDYATEERDVLADWTAASAAGVGNYALGRLSAAFKDGQVLLVGHLQEGVSGAVNADCIRQWASSDLGTQLITVSTTLSTEGNGPADVVVSRGMFVVAFLAPGGASALRTRRLGSAFTPFDTAAELQAAPWSPNNLATYGTTPARVLEAELALVADDAGILWVFVTNHPGSGGLDRTCSVAWSDDGGRNWNTVGIDPTDPTNVNGTAVWWRPHPAGASGSDNHPVAYVATFQRGRVLLVHNWVADVAVNDGSLSVLYLGGYHTLTVPPTRDGARLADRVSWASTRLPLERPTDTAAWATTTTGTAFDLLVAGGQRFVSGDGVGAAGSYYAQQDDTTPGDVAFVGTWTCAVEDGDRTTDKVEMRVRIDDGTRGVEISIRQDDDGFIVRDVNAGTDLVEVSNLKEHAAQEFRLGVYRSEDGTSRGWHLQYREADTSEDKVWKIAGSGALADATTTANNYVRFGNVGFAGAVTTVKSTWYHGPSFSFGDIGSVHCPSGSADWWHDWVAADNPGRLAGRPVAGTPIYVAGGIRVRGVDGPLLAGQTWRVRPRFEWPAERVFPDHSPSPREPWQAADEAQQIVPVVLDPGLLDTASSHAGAPLMALVLVGINWRTGTLQRRDGAAWTDVVDVDASLGALSYTRQGATLLPSADASLNLAAHELVGWDARMGSTVRRVKGNRNGRWGTGTAAGPRTRVYLTGAQAGDPASGSVHLCARGLVVLFHVPSTADTLTAWRLVIDAQGTVDGKLQTGAAWVGPAWLAARAPDWGVSERFQPGHVAQEGRDRTRSVARPAPGRHTVALAWPNDIDTTQWHGSDEPDWRSIASTGSTLEGVATLAGTVYDLQGEVEELRGHPVAYCPRVPREALGTAVTLRRRHEWMYAAVDGDMRVNEGLGDPRTRTLTVGSLDLVEVV